MPLVDFVDDLQVSWEQFLHQLDRPALQGFRENRVVGVGKGPCGDVPGLRGREEGVSRASEESAERKPRSCRKPAGFPRMGSRTAWAAVGAYQVFHAGGGGKRSVRGTQNSPRSPVQDTPLGLHKGFICTQPHTACAASKPLLALQHMCNCCTCPGLKPWCAKACLGMTWPVRNTRQVALWARRWFSVFFLPKPASHHVSIRLKHLDITAEVPLQCPDTEERQELSRRLSQFRQGGTQTSLASAPHEWPLNPKTEILGQASLSTLTECHLCERPA